MRRGGAWGGRDGTSLHGDVYLPQRIVLRRQHANTIARLIVPIADLRRRPPKARDADHSNFGPAAR
jgi:hypothetical protein